jgi:hypothetical protein
MSAPGPSVVAGSRPEIALILAAARVHLAREDAEQIRASLQGDLDWAYLLRTALRNSVMPLLHRSLVAVAPERVPPDVLDQLRGAFQDNALRNLRMTAALLKLLDEFRSHDLVAIPYKGPTLAALAYGNLAFRAFVDLDLFVPQRDFTGARDLLIAQGYRLAYPLTPTQEAAYVASLGQLPLVSGDGILVELHTAVALRDYGFRIEPDRPGETLSHVSLLGRDVPTFSVENLLLILCAHGGRHCWGSLGWICDVAELIRTRSDVRWEEVLDEARRFHAQRLLLLGVALAGALLRAPIPDLIGAQIRADPAIPWLCAQVQHWLFCETDELPGRSGQLSFQLRARERRRDGVRYCLSQVLVPRISDWEAITLPPSLAFAYPFLRPLRLAKKYGLSWLRGRERPSGARAGSEREP